MKMRSLLTLGSISAVIAIILGAMGAHFLKPYMTEAGPELFKTGIQYHFWHSLALFVCAFYIPLIKENAKALRFIKLAAYAFIIGMVLFSGMIYLLALGLVSTLHFLIPLGGFSFIIGWVFMVLASLKIKY